LHGQALADFEKLVIEGGAVDPEGLGQRIRQASRLLFLRESDNQLVGVGGEERSDAEFRKNLLDL
jgi:hypothetical protein